MPLTAGSLSVPAPIPLFRRRVDGSPAVRIGEGRGGGPLSPDGRWLLTSSGVHLVALPTGAGSPITLPNGMQGRFGSLAWLGDSKRIVFMADGGIGSVKLMFSVVQTQHSTETDVQ